MFRPFATPSLSSSSTDSGDEDLDDDGEEFRRHASSGLDAQPGTARETKRQSLFTSGSSDFVLAASIFKVVGTPTIESWPVRLSLLLSPPSFAFVFFPSLAFFLVDIRSFGDGATWSSTGSATLGKLCEVLVRCVPADSTRGPLASLGRVPSRYLSASGRGVARSSQPDARLFGVEPHVGARGTCEARRARAE